MVMSIKTTICKWLMKKRHQSFSANDDFYFSHSTVMYSVPIIPGALPPPPKKSKQNNTFDFSDIALISSYLFYTLLNRTSFPDYNTKLIKFGWEQLISWVIFYGLSFSGFARFKVPTHLWPVHTLSEYRGQWSVYCLTRIYNPGTSLHWVFFVAG